jgi:hypothetical protein
MKKLFILQKKENDGYIHVYDFEMTDGGMAVEKTPHITHSIKNEKGTYFRRMSVKKTTKEAGNEFYKELIKKGYKRI